MCCSFFVCVVSSCGTQQDDLSETTTAETQTANTEIQSKLIANTSKFPVDLELPRGQLSIFNNTTLGIPSDAVIELIKAPKQGVARLADGHLEYQHGGANLTADHLLVRWTGTEGAGINTPIRLHFREVEAVIEITSPKTGDVFPVGMLSVTYKLSGRDFDHLHIALNDEGHNTIRELSGQFDLQLDKPGSHQVSAQLVDAQHRAIRVPQARHEVQINVR